MRVCALLVLPTSAFAQSTKGPTVFSPAAQVGAVNLRAAVVLADYTVKPLPLLKVVAVRNSERPDSTVTETDLEGRSSMNLKVGMYTVLAKTTQPLGGHTYTWAVRIVVRPQQSQTLQLTNSNATIDSVATTPTVVAEAKPQPTTPPQSAAPTPPQSATPPRVATSQPTTPKAAAQQPTTSKPAAPQPTAPKSTTPPKPTVPTVTETKAVAKSQPPQPAPTPTQSPAKPLTPAPTTPSNPPQAAPSTPVTTAQSKPVVPAPTSSPAPAAKRTEVAQRPRRTNTNGFMVGLAFDASSIRSDGLNNASETGPGVAGLLGWGVTKNIALILDMSGAQISSVNGNYNLGHADIGARIHFVNRTAFVPFIDAGYAGRAVMMRNVNLADTQGNISTGTLTYMGSGVAVGGGLEYFVTRAIAFGGSYKWTTGKFTQARFENSAVDGLPLPDATSARFNMGFTWYPMGR